MTKNYRWGILGAGRIAEKFCTALKQVTGAELYAVASQDASRGGAFAERFGVEHVYTDYEAMMKDENVDIIYIATPHVFHHAQSIACIQHRKHVLCEKPLSLSIAQSTEILQLAASNQVFFMEGMWTACMPILQQMKEQLAAGSLGTPVYLSADFGFAAPPEPEGRLFNKSLGGGALMDVGVYPIFLAISLLGNPTSVTSVAKKTATGVDEYCHILFQYDGGTSAHLFASIACNTSIEAQLFCTEGKITLHNPWFKATEMSVTNAAGETSLHAVPHEVNGFEHEIREVLACVDAGLLQSEKMPHHLTLSVSSVVEEVLKQVELQYDV